MQEDDVYLVISVIKAAYTPNPYAVHKIYMAVQCAKSYPLEINTHQPVIPSFLSLH